MTLVRAHTSAKAADVAELLLLNKRRVKRLTHPLVVVPSVTHLPPFVKIG